jgi:hypothetical protein
MLLVLALEFLKVVRGLLPSVSLLVVMAVTTLMLFAPLAARILQIH